ncbi:probable peptidoglycan muropeptide transporter SLC46 isoform X1 [Drosophila virilis]|uniref:Uncharacterized protein, isoform A n=2 Tax=Drosophila virilis TaxID=7244 RepID=B4M5W2_DROVI|nr:uncharacterized protein LOC6632923 [Drosophila virilis]XP_015025987.1 uncharacterized protein LOC6632923 [Drosophila virilis]EDW59038.1 uncharacterized protein Dvir_GJ10656, isoform A [Drosophila virilis]KRF78645.1 uncharacterized protein Dvir_GJ10656, isoform B [Drosophila virilis]
MVEKVSISTAVDKLKSLPWRELFYMFYIEPVVFMLIFSHLLSGTVMRNQIIYQTCRVIFHYNETDCRQLDDKDASHEVHAIETEIQSYVADMFLIRTLMESIVPAVCGLFIGSWSDHYGRKPLLVVSMIGFSGSALINTLICALSSSRDINPWWYTMAAVPHSLLGGMCVFSVAAFCFLSDITDIRTRPYRMIAIEFLMFIAISSGSLLSSYVYEATSASITQSISAAIVVLATLFIICCVPESLHIRLEKDAAESAERTEKPEKDVPLSACDMQLNTVSIDCPNDVIDDEKKEHDKQIVPITIDTRPKAATDTKNISLFGLKINDDKQERSTNVLYTSEKHLDERNETKQLDSVTNEAKQQQQQNEPEAATDANNMGLFSLTHIKDMFRTCCKPRDNHAREIIWLVTLAMFMAMFVVDGAMTVMYLFVRQKFHWSVREFTLFETISQMVPMVGALIGILLLRKVFGLSVVTLALLSLFSEILSNLTRGCASFPWHMYLSVAFGIFRSIGGPMCRTIVSNIVPASDLGKIFSIKNVFQSFAPFVAAPLYTLIYQHSLSVFPGLFNFLSAALFLVAFVAICFVWRFKYMHKQHYAELLK